MPLAYIYLIISVVIMLAVTFYFILRREDA